MGAILFVGRGTVRIFIGVPEPTQQPLASFSKCQNPPLLHSLLGTYFYFSFRLKSFEGGVAVLLLYNLHLWV